MKVTDAKQQCPKCTQTFYFFGNKTYGKEQPAELCPRCRRRSQPKPEHGKPLDRGHANAQ